MRKHRSRGEAYEWSECIAVSPLYWQPLPEGVLS